MKKIIGGTKDENGMYIAEPKKDILVASPPISIDPVAEDISIDNLIGRGLVALDRLMKVIMINISSGAPNRDTVMNLRDAMAMLHSLKEKEKELIDGLSDEALEKIAKK